MRDIRFRPGQIWGAGRNRMRRRRIVFVDGRSVAFREEGKAEWTPLTLVTGTNFADWVRAQGAVLLAHDAAVSWPKVSDEEIGRRLRARRVEGRLSQDDVARQSGVSRTAVALWERGKRGCSMRNLAEIAVAVGIDFDTLVADLPAAAESSGEEGHLLGLFRQVDAPSRAEVLRWLEYGPPARRRRSGLAICWRCV